MSVRKLRILIIFVLIFGVVGAGGWVVVKKRAAAGKKATVVRVEELQPTELQEFVSAPAELEPKSRVEISAKVSGRVEALPFKVGERVTKGDPNANPPIPPSLIVQLDSKDLASQLLGAQARRAAQAATIESERARLASQKATLIGTGATLEQAKTQMERQKKLLESKDISQYDFDQAQLKLDELQAQYNAAKLGLDAADLNLRVLQHNLEAADAQIKQSEETLGYTTIVSPLDGVVTRVNAKVGEMVVTGMMNNPGTKILEVGDLSQMLAVAQTDEADVGKLEVGQKVRVFSDADPSDEFNGTVYTIALSTDLSRQGTKYYKTEILLESDRRLYSGLTANVDIQTRKYSNVLSVPSQAVMTREIENLPIEIRDSSPYVDKTKTFATVVFRYIDGKAVITPVKIGPSNLTHTILEAGVEKGDKVIMGPYKELEKLKHDQVVKDEREAKAEEEAKKKLGQQSVNPVDAPREAKAEADAKNKNGTKATGDAKDANAVR